MTDPEKPDLKPFIVFIILIISVVILSVFFISTDNNSSNNNMPDLNSTISGSLKSQRYSKPPSLAINQKKTYRATMTTSKGIIVIDLFAKDNPVTVNNFVFLSKEGFYNNTTFHRVVKGFMIQGGDPLGNGSGGPGYKFDDEKITLDYQRGIVAMANSGPNTNGSQFFIMHNDYNLPKNYVIFGKVTEGLDVVDKIASVPVTEGGSGEKSSPTEKITIEKVEISET